MEKDGILLVDKPEGVSSARVVSIIKRRFKVKKVGHTGTLDPFATGLLPIALGKGTKLSRFYLGGDKAYIATVRLGEQTDTYDKTGTLIERADDAQLEAITPEQVQDAVAGFLGPQEQIPPSYSALKHKGVPLYKLARQGEMIQKPPRKITIFDIRIIGMDLPEVEIFVSCTGGTYIRSIAHDLGKMLGCGAHLSALRRTQSSQFSIDHALALPKIEAMDSDQLPPHILSPSQCLPFLPRIIVDPMVAQRIRHGQKLDVEAVGRPLEGQGEYIRLTDGDDRLLALVSPDGQGLTYNYCCVFIN